MRSRWPPRPGGGAVAGVIFHGDRGCEDVSSETVHYDVAVDFMDMTNDGRVWVRAVDARPGVKLAVGRHVIVGDEDADPRVAQIVATDADGNVELMVPAGSVESHQDLLARAWKPAENPRAVRNRAVRAATGRHR